MTRQYSEKLGEALKLAADAFASRIRKGTGSGERRPIPYITHLLQVAAWVAENRGDEEQIIAAVLHDYLEDIDGATEEEIVERFGERVARMVVALSDTQVRPKPPWHERKTAYIEKLRDEPAEVKLISACDKLHNASSILIDLTEDGDAVWDRFKATKEQSLWYYEQVTEALAEGWDHPLVERLRATVGAIKAAC